MVKKPHLKLETNIRYVKGVGPKIASRLAKLNIETIADIINHYPFRHEDYSQITPIELAQPGKKVTLIGNIKKITSNYTRSAKQKTIQTAILEDETGQIDLVWFNQPYLKKNLQPPKLVSVSGKINQRNNQLQIIYPDYEILNNKNEKIDNTIGVNLTKDTGRLVPIYPTTQGISSKYLRKIISLVLPKVKDQIIENLPLETLANNKLISKNKAILEIHFPENKKALHQARYRLAFEELLIIHLKKLQKKQNWKKQKNSPIMSKKIKVLKRFLYTLPFELTQAQKNAIAEITNDINKKQAMNRLLQGDVGSGKTVVAAVAALQTVKNNYQAVLMAPTEILAQQHYHNLSKMLQPFEINCQLLTSSHKPSSPSSKDLIIGTHALIHQYANFIQVGLVIIDEQHRFGVTQRGKLIKKAQIADKDNLFPHVLTMTATPIPRTITLTIYGDLDVSTLDELPPGRMPVKTYLVPSRKRQKCYQWIKSKIKKGHQGFIICPLVEESENLESVKSATDEYHRLSQRIFPNVNLGLLHGQMKSSQKENVLQQMNRGEIDILVATPVVEVGIDIPNANFMIIETANRFGLAQLHQLRGRIGRGNKQAYCFLFAQKIGKKAKKRLVAMENITNGLKLAEIDLKIRGPGEIYGTKQHGYLELKIASYNDIEMIKKTRQAAAKILTKSPNLDKYPQLKQTIYNGQAVKPLAQN